MEEAIEACPQRNPGTGLEIKAKSCWLCFAVEDGVKSVKAFLEK